jgi:hypothetical protein
MSLSKLIFFVITLYCLVFITAAYSATFVTSEYHEKIPKKILVDHFEKRIDRTKKSITMQEFDLFIENGTVFFVSKKGPEKGKKQNLNQYYDLYVVVNGTMSVRPLFQFFYQQIL